MRVAALYDVHSNVHALDAVLAEVDADAIVFGGDLVWGPFPRETLERVRALDNAHVVRGNCEREVAGDRSELEPELWALLGGGVELRRTSYDVEAAAAAVRASDFPFPRLAGDLLQPRGAQATMRRFEAAR